MDELRSFYNKPPSQRVMKLRGPKTCGLHLTKDDEQKMGDRKKEHLKSALLGGVNYIQEPIKREMESYMMYNTIDQAGGSTIGLNSLERLPTSVSTTNCQELNDEAMNQIYNKYSFKLKDVKNNLMISSYKSQILDSIETQPVTIIEGPTGCGKTTQVPQWILDHSYEKRAHCKIIVTQPRRIAAISIAKRVAQERGWDLGGLVGYQVGLDNKTTTDTRISYVTTGLLLQKLVASKTLNEYTHVVLDEVHERGQEMDFLLLVVRRLLHTVSPRVKVILMSATFNFKLFGEYFVEVTPTGMEPTPCIKIEKKNRMFDVKTFYLNHLLKKFGQIENYKTIDGSPKIDHEMYKLVIRLLNAFDHIDKQEGDCGANDQDIPSVLIFLPGINEIEELYNCLTDTTMRTKLAEKNAVMFKWKVLPLHSTITADEQVRVFHPVHGHRKIILSTNIAESSITVPDIKYVVDFCLMKVLVADEQTNFTSLRLQWASKTNCQQRAGRAGRVRDGRVYRLVHESHYEKLPDDCPPEIKRCPLDRLVLLAKMLDMGPPADVLALAMDPPDLSNIHLSLLTLKEIGAMKKTLNGELCLLDGDLTYLGRMMAKLPLDVRVSKLIMLGHTFGCLNETIIIAAAMSVKDVFSSPFRERLNAYNSKLTWADGSTSDCIAYLNVYMVWKYLRQTQEFKKPDKNEHAWARDFYVQVRALRELHDLVREITLRLSRENIEVAEGKSPWSKSELTLALKIVIAGAFYPHMFVLTRGGPELEQDAARALGGLDARSAVYLADFPRGQPPQPYAGAVRDALLKLTADRPRVVFDQNSSKVYLVFDDASYSSGTNTGNKRSPTVPGKVVLPVYKAVKARKLGIPLTINLLPEEKAHELALALEASKLNVEKDKMVPRLPAIDDSYFPLKISQFVNCGRFWVQYDDEDTADSVRQIEEALNRTPLTAVKGAAPGDLVAAPYCAQGPSRYYRARVHKVEAHDMLWVLFIDYGTLGRVSASGVRALPPGGCRAQPPLAMQCALAAVAPSTLLDAHAAWVPAATACFQATVENRSLMAKVYSVVNGVVSIELLVNQGHNAPLSVNELLLNKGFAQPCEESYESRMNHDLRSMAADLKLKEKQGHDQLQRELAFTDLREHCAPRTGDGDQQARLKGPFSPLETTVHSLMHASRGKPVDIQGSSVNSVLLNTEPQELYERCLIAGEVGTGEGASRLSLRHTTLMPNLPGLPAILALLFCPVAELRRSACCTRYVSALCGLGCTEDGRPLYPEHDLLVNIDVDLGLEDLGLINHTRHLMDFMVYCAPGQDQPAVDDSSRPKVAKCIRENLIKLLGRRRKHYDWQSVPREWEWLSSPADEVLALDGDELRAREVLYPLHAPLDLRPRDRPLLAQLRERVRQLHDSVSRNTASSKQVSCPLCESAPMSAQAMRIHLHSRAHLDKETDFNVLDS